LVELAAAVDMPLPEDIRFYPGMGLEMALDCFETTLAVLQTPDAIMRVAAEICEDASADGVTTLEIRFAPQLHGDAAVAIDAAIDGVAGRAGLILCGLYGEDPRVLSDLVELARSRPQVVGLDLAGGPTSGQDWCLADYATPYAQAADIGLGRTVHAGEGRPAEEIRIAIEVLGAQRIGHGTTLLQEPAVLDLVLEREITIEACPTSNVHTGAIASIAEHPLKAWLTAGVRACVCTDNTLLSHVRASEEFENISQALDLSPEQREQVVANGHRAAFVRG
jgi:adenosine deaminase